jgi:hypothetical protein
LSLCFLPGVKAGQLKHCLLQKIKIVKKPCANGVHAQYGHVHVSPRRPSKTSTLI